MYIINTYDLGPGDTVWVDSGTYNEDPVTITSADSGDDTGYVTFQGAGSGINLVASGNTILNGGFLLMN